MARKPFFLKEWRDLKGLTQEQLGARLDPMITGASVSRIETGVHNYTRERLEAFAAALDIEVADLFRDPTKPDYQLWQIIIGLEPDDQERALRMIKAMAG